MLTLGVDGCPGGWLAASARWPSGCAGGGPASLSWAVHPDLSRLLASPPAREAGLIVIDVPIGLSDGPPRPCDREARLRLGPRRASVFAPPMRAMLAMPDREAASAYGQGVRPGGGVSAQSWNILPKIKEADAAMTRGLQARVREGHPEVAFARLAGAPMPQAKKTRAGRAARLRTLADAGLDASGPLAGLTARRPRPAAPDDLIDACVLAVTARDALAGTAWVLGGARDARGLRMEILG